MELGLWLAVAWLGWLLWREAQLRWHRRPPLVTSMVPFVGCMVALGRGPPARFIARCREKHGPVFTVHVGGRHLTFVMDPQLFPSFFDETSGAVDFTAATQPFLTLGFGVPRDAYLRHHGPLLALVRNALAPARLDARHYAEVLTSSWARMLAQTWGRRRPDDGRQSPAPARPLLADLRHAVFYASLRALFGDGFGDDAAVREQFRQFDDRFELASSGVPHALLPSFTGARGALLAHLDAVSRGFRWAEDAAGGGSDSALDAAAPFLRPGEALPPLLAQELLRLVQARVASSWLLAVRTACRWRFGWWPCCSPTPAARGRARRARLPRCRRAPRTRRGRTRSTRRCRLCARACWRPSACGRRR